MFFVAHIAIAFIISYFIIRRFQLRDVSLSLVLFLSMLPDIDILFRLVGIEIAHRSITHSMIIFAIPLLIFFLKYRISSFTIYFIGYVSHLAIGDIIIGPSNLLSPFGHLYLNSGIYYMGLEHILIELAALIIMVITVFGEYIFNRKRITFPIKYSIKLDPIFYPAVMAGIIISCVYLLYQSQEYEFPDSISSSFKSYVLPQTILILHTLCIAVLALMWIISQRSLSTLDTVNNLGIDKSMNVKMDR